MTFFQRLAAWFSSYAPAPPSINHQPSTINPPRLAAVGPRALNLILEFEGIDQPYRRPPGDSGITIGHGFDLGYNTPATFREAWSRHLPAPDITLLLPAIGKKGPAAEALEPRFANVTRITPAMAREVFDRCTLPEFRRRTAQAFPGLQILTPDQQGVLVSLVFNRGESLKGDRRREMANIATILLSRDSAPAKANAIAFQLLAMQRIWPSDSPASGHPGLRRRRRAEAALMTAPA